MRQITFQRVKQSDAVKQARIGELGQTEDGRVWRYIKANEAISKGHIVTRAANTDQDTVSSTTDGNGNETIIEDSSASFTVGDFDNSYGLVDAGTGSGQFFKIKTNDATKLFLYPEYALSTSLDIADSDIVIVTPYHGEKSATSTLNQVLVGAAQTDFSDGDYGWVLQRGPGEVIVGEAASANQLITPGDDTEGHGLNADADETVDDISAIGRVLVANGTADEAAMVDVNIF